MRYILDLKKDQRERETANEWMSFFFFSFLLHKMTREEKVGFGKGDKIDRGYCFGCFYRLDLTYSCGLFLWCSLMCSFLFLFFFFPALPSPFCLVIVGNRSLFPFPISRSRGIQIPGNKAGLFYSC